MIVLKYKYMQKVLLVLSLTFILSGCSNSNWTGFYYPDKNNIGNESSWTVESGFSNIEECRAWVENTAGSNDSYDYECGYKCSFDKGYGMTICKTTEK